MSEIKITLVALCDLLGSLFDSDSNLKPIFFKHAKYNKTDADTVSINFILFKYCNVLYFSVYLMENVKKCALIEILYIKDDYKTSIGYNSSTKCISEVVIS